jgi:hypothetical protein
MGKCFGNSKVPHILTIIISFFQSSSLNLAGAEQWALLEGLGAK